MKNNFWTKYRPELKGLYKFSAIEVPSDIPAYNLAYWLLSPKGKVVLDFGCFNGSGSKLILDLGAKKVIGVDKIRQHIIEAKKLFEKDGSLIFKENYELKSGQFDNLIDGVAMTFVHPTIHSQEELANVFGLIAQVSKKGANLVILGINPQCLNKNFLFYKFKPIGNNLFENNIRLPHSKKKVSFVDHCWTEEVLTEVLEKNGFRVNKILPVGLDLKGPAKKILDSSLKSLKDRYPKIIWKDEWKASMYQIILAQKK
jgi:SAM-dependent methyltransferase